MRQSPSRTTLAVILLVCLQGFANATIIYYPSQYADFDEAYNVAQPGDTIFIEAGTHHIVHDLQKSCLTILGAGMGNTIMYNSFFAVTTPDTCHLIKNISFEAHNGNSILIYGGCRIDSCEFLDGYGSDLGAIKAEANYIIRNCKIHGNDNASGTAYGGGLKLDGPGEIGIVENNEIYNNTAYAGGAIFVASTGNSIVIRNNVIYSNSATDRGGAICFVGRTCELVNNTFVGNNAPLGSAFWFSWNNASELGPYHNNIIANQTGGPAIYNGSSLCFFGQCNEPPRFSRRLFLLSQATWTCAFPLR